MTEPIKPATRKKTRQERRDERRDALKEAAIQVFSEQGFHGAKVSDIVKLVGVAQGTFYLYFKGKDQIFGELLDDFMQLVVETVANWEPDSLETRAHLGEELTRVGLMLTEVLINNPEMTTIFFKEALSSTREFDEKLRDFYGTLGLMLTTFNRILCERGLIKPMNFQILAVGTIGQVERIISEHVVNQGFGQDIQPREIVEHLVMLFLSGTEEPIASPSTAPGKASS